MAMFLTVDYVTLSIIAVSVALLVAERAIKRFGYCNKKDELVKAIHDLRGLVVELSSKSSSSDKTSSSEEVNEIVKIL